MTYDQIKNRAEDFRKLALLLSEGDEALSADVALSEIDPAAYIHAHAKELNMRGIRKPVGGLPWIALTDALLKSGKLIELDWKESGEMFVAAVKQLLEKEENAESAKAAVSSVDRMEGSDVAKVLSSINQALEPHGYGILMIDLFSDCYPIVLFRLSSDRSIVELADRIEKGRIWRPNDVNRKHR